MMTQGMQNKHNGKVYLTGIDIGSTTTKAVVLESESGCTLYSEYTRHHARQAESVKLLLETLQHKFPGAKFRVCLTGSGASVLAEHLGVPFIQEVVSNSLVLRREHPQVRTAIELGGQDAKMIFFQTDNRTGNLNVADMRMNGSCAGGTGAFIDEIASVLRISVEEFENYAARGKVVYDISGRCGVYAKTDIQPLLNQGASKEDLALSAFHAIAKQTIGGLAQGLDICPPIVFEGGPLTFNPTLIRVFSERLHLEDNQVLIPSHPELIVARGAALSFGSLFADRTRSYFPSELLDRFGSIQAYSSSCACDTVSKSEQMDSSQPFFPSIEEQKKFEKRHFLHPFRPRELHAGDHVHAYLGVDCGSTTTKLVLIDEDENLLDVFYASNYGDPLKVAKEALLAIRNRYRTAGAKLDILNMGSTGYGELLIAKAFNAGCHTVETVAHARATEKYIGDATFILDIGGQDMKAIWLDHGVITNILVNEACSSGCGSFLENFAATLHISTEEIARSAFSSKSPAVLGSRCTVFMNSSIITEQRNGKKPQDIMAGLCRSIIANVFTKVIRISNLDSLGDRVVVQGGTFLNDAVLCAFEQYIGRPVIRAPYPGLMGAIGIALLSKEQFQQNPQTAAAFTLDNLENFEWKRENNSICPGCMNHCNRTIMRFSNGNTWVTGNRCERGELPDPAKGKSKTKAKVPLNLYKVREKLLFADYAFPQLLPNKNTVIGIPRVLSYWETMPFWTTFWKSLGYKVRLSDKSTRKMYENGLQAVTSDTVCFPAKLVHGHLRALETAGVDRIFMPVITTVPSENQEKTSQSMCAVVKGYPIVIRNSDNPEQISQIPFDSPLFHWYRTEDRNRQLSDYMQTTFNIAPEITLKAAQAGDQAQAEFQTKLKQAGAQVLQDIQDQESYAVVLASRPYQNDDLVNHNIPDLFVREGVSVLTADSIPDLDQIDLSKSRLDIVNNYHARMLASAVYAARNPRLQYVQLVSFGCGHDAYLSDEIIRLMREISGKTPLILKVDESDIQGPLRIRIRSFLETAATLYKQEQPRPQDLQDPYPVKFTKQDHSMRTVLVPNTSHAFCRIMSAAMASQHMCTVPLAVGREEAIRLGKKYVHNDICFPAQVVIGECIAALKSGEYDPDKTAVGMGKYIGDCRLTHYSALLRKALDDAGFSNVPILTNDDVDSHALHPGYRMDIHSALMLAFGLPMIDIYEELLRKIRPYELKSGSTDHAFELAMDDLERGMRTGGIHGSLKGFKKGIDRFCQVQYDRSTPRPRVLIVGEYLLNFHPGANHDIEDYLEKNGLELIEARMTDVIRKTYFYQHAQVKEYHLKKSVKDRMWLETVNIVFNLAHSLTEKIARKHPLFEPVCRMQDLVKQSDPIIHHTFDAGEGVLIPGEILHHASKGCRAFVILQPFGCLPNHVVGRGIVKRLKELYPDAQILPLDYDPDVSFANIENRLQMLIMNARQGCISPAPESPEVKVVI